VEIRKIFKTGNSLVVSLPRPLLAELGLGEGDPVSCEVDARRGGLVLRPVLPAARQGPVGREFCVMVEDFLGRYEDVLKELDG